MTGTIKTRHENGFGFISGGDGKDYFFHRTSLEADAMFDLLAVGDEVEFDAVSPAPSKGPRARDVRYPDPDPVKEEV